ncbi:MAG: endonuclease MutS2 [Tissierellia bacterium]|nr:endonuclease MutS2 [Tissierellia bacterium]
MASSRRSIESILEFDRILEQLKDRCASSLGRSGVEELEFLTDAREIFRAQEETEEAVRLLSVAPNVPLFGATPMAQSAGYAQRGGVLEIHQILNIGDGLRGVRLLKEFIQERDEELFPYFVGISEGLWTDGALERKIERTIESDSTLYDHASDELFRIRKKIAGKKDQLRGTLQAILSQTEEQGHLQDALVTMRGGRYVIPVRKDAKSKVPGLVHDMSQTGQTVYIEPMAVVENNNELRELELQEREEIRRILKELSEWIGQYPEEFKENEVLYRQLDLTLAKGRLAIDTKAIRPKLNEERYSELHGAKHPLLDQKTVVPLSVTLGGDFNQLIITGPNTGGKTVTLKTFGLMVLMHQYGLHIPAEEGSELGIYSGVYADIGDEQSIEQSLSTFSAHMGHIIQILEDVDYHGLVLFDELGAGTDPTEGAALAIAIIEYLRDRGIHLMATTHYNPLKLYALTREGVENGSMEFDLERLVPTYRLILGVPGKSNAFEIARRLGLGRDVLEEAHRRLEREDIVFEDVLGRLEKERAQYEEQREALEVQERDLKIRWRRLEGENRALKNQREKILEEARKEAKEMVQRAKEDVDLAVSEIKDLKEFLEKDEARTIQGAQDLLREDLKHLRAKDRGIVIEKASNPAQKVKPGDSVFAESLGVEATVLEPEDNKGNVLIQAGLMKLTVPRKALILRKPEKKTPKNRGSARKVMKDKVQNAKTEVDIRGKTFEDALPILDKSIDDAFLSNVQYLRIIHGKGTGALGRKVKDYLKKHPAVKSQEVPQPEEGGTGVTVAHLK